MPGYGQFCPVAQALEVVGERWTLLIVRELLCGNYRFNEILNGVPLMSRSLLAQRLKALEDAKLIQRQARPGGGHEYLLTPAGRELEPVVMGLGAWGQRWVRRHPDSDDLDPLLLMWDMRRNLDLARLPDETTVVMFWFRDLRGNKSRYWLKLARPEVELCLTNPGLAVELTIETTLRTMVEVWMGHRDLRDAIRDGAIDVQGAAHLTKAFPRWLTLSRFATIARPQLDKSEPAADTRRKPLRALAR